MRRLIGGLLAVLLLAAPAWAYTEVYSWAPVTGATSYNVYKSVDSGTTWTLVASPTTPTYTYTGTETGLTLFRVAACNAQGCGLRAGDGFFHNDGWIIPLAPGGLQVQ